MEQAPGILFLPCLVVFTFFPKTSTSKEIPLCEKTSHVFTASSHRKENRGIFRVFRGFSREETRGNKKPLKTPIYLKINSFEGSLMVRPGGIEPPTFCSVGRSSIQLSYGRLVPVADLATRFIVVKSCYGHLSSFADYYCFNNPGENGFAE